MPATLPAGAEPIRGRNPGAETVKSPDMKTLSPTISGKPEPRPRRKVEWQLRLYVAGLTPKSRDALANLRRICETHLAGSYEIEVIDLAKNPQLAEGDQILAVPTLVRKFPEPIRKIIGDLSSIERVLVALDVQRTEG